MKNLVFHIGTEVSNFCYELLTLESLAKYSISTLGTSAKSALHRVPVTCWYCVLPSIECNAWPISWNKLSTEEGFSKQGFDHFGAGNDNIKTTIGFWNKCRIFSLIAFGKNISRNIPEVILISLKKYQKKDAKWNLAHCFLIIFHLSQSFLYEAQIWLPRRGSFANNEK